MATHTTYDDWKEVQEAVQEYLLTVYFGEDHWFLTQEETEDLAADLGYESVEEIGRAEMEHMGEEAGSELVEAFNAYLERNTEEVREGEAE